MFDVARVQSLIDSGDSLAVDQLMPLMYADLRKMASQLLAKEAAEQTLQPTALVHEAYVRLAGKDGSESNWDNPGHFFSAAAEAMRRLLVENARRKKRLKRGGSQQRISLESAEFMLLAPREDLLAIDEALARLIAQDPFKSEVVKLRFFAGLTMPEIAESLNLSLATVERYWTFARTWLYAELTNEKTD